jgi:hypothetical protein
MFRHDVQCNPGESVFEAAHREWGAAAYVEGTSHPGSRVYAHNAPNEINGRPVIGTVTVRRNESFYVTQR